MTTNSLVSATISDGSTHSDDDKINELLNSMVNSNNDNIINDDDEDDDMMANSKSSYTNSTGHPTKNASEQSEIASAETRMLQKWRTILALVLAATAVAICTGTYVFVQNKAKDDFQLSFTLFANSMEAQLGNHADNLESGLRNLGDTVTASSLGEEDEGIDFGQQQKETSFPFVSVSHWETHGEHARERSKMEAVAYAPLVRSSQKKEWESFAIEHDHWIQASRSTYLDHLRPGIARPVYLAGKVPPFIYAREHPDSVFTDPVEDANEQQGGGGEEEVYAPIWYLSPPPFNPAIVNFDVLSDREYKVVLQQAIDNQASAFSPVMNVEPFSSLQVSDADHLHYHQQFKANFSTVMTDPTTGAIRSGTIGYHLPHSLYAQPVYETSQNTNVVGILWGAIAWDAYLADLLPEGVEGVNVVLNCTCAEETQYYTYELNGAEPTYSGQGDLHDHSYDSMVRHIPFRFEQKESEVATTNDEAVCRYSMNVYPSSTFEQAYASPIAFIATATVAATFLIVAIIFVIYDVLVKQRNQTVTKIAKQSNNVVNSLFPEAVRERLMENNGESDMWNTVGAKNGQAFTSKPIADLFPEATIMFADMAGFTAWSSMREPSQVFILLESVYAEFDELSRRRRVFKVETIGDCYVACAGVPNPRKDHASVMARFARDCVNAFRLKVKELEVLLGPDTEDLAIRVGLHSGPVTAGVLRGDKARFQLFGDSMNVASRIESTGARNKIHCSQETANLLMEAGRADWVFPREDKVHAKGKGELTTFWIKFSGGSSDGDGNSVMSQSVGSEDLALEDNSHIMVSGKNARLVDWNCEVIVRYLKCIVANRKAAGKAAGQNISSTGDMVLKPKDGQFVLDEVSEIIKLPTFDSKVVATEKDAASVELPPAVLKQLRDFLMRICLMYHDNPFHNFEHASHVTMSITKLMSRIVAPSVSFDETSQNHDASSMHDHTYGITSDPLTQLAVVISGVIHDLDHPGVPNAQLVKEGTELAEHYRGNSVAEQNSIDLGWELLMSDQYRDLRACIYGDDEADLSRFRKLVVNSVMATDIVDKSLKNLRETRWKKAFSGDHVDDDHQQEVNRKATIVIEHLIQASDVAHTMQHWHVYRKWNSRFFLECYKAYKDGRAEKDPAEFWFKGEIGFFDFYIIPLAKKLKECGVFGVSSDEYLNYAMKNREEWLARGEDVVAALIKEGQELYG